MRKFLLIALCLLSMNVLAVTKKVTVWQASASGSSGDKLVKGLKNADGSDGSDAFQGSVGNFYFNTGVDPSWSWDRYMTIAPAAFANIDMQEGDLLNVMLNYTDGKSQIALKQANASKFDGCTEIASSSSVSSGSYSLELTSSIISQIRSKGLAIGGINLNWNEVSISPEGYTPPVTLLDKPGFHTDGVRLLDANGKEFLMRGYNYSYAWQKDLWGAAFSTAKKYNCNALRIQLSDGQKDLGGYCDADQVSKLISSCKENHFIGVFNVQDTGGGNDKNVLLHAADYWVGIKNAVIGQEKYCIVNIGNEWMGSPGRDCNGEWGDYQENLWSDTYIEAVRRIRSAGIKNTLMIDCNGYGQYADIIWKEGQRILDEDKKYFKDGKPNIIFSIHFYEKACYWDYEKGVGSRVAHSIDKALSIGAPVCIGEYAYSRKSEEWKMDWETIQDYSKTMNIGYLGWSFTGNGDAESQGLDMFNNDGSKMYKNGECIIQHPNDGILATSVICSVYEGGAESHITERYVSGGEASADVQSYLKDANDQALDYVKLNIPEASLELNQEPGLTLKGADLKRAGALEGRFFRIFLKPGTTITNGKEDKLYGAAFAATANITYGNLKTGDRSLSEWKYIDLPCDRNSADLTIKGKYCTIEGIYLMKPEYLYKEGQAETELKATYNLGSDYVYNKGNEWGTELYVPASFFQNVQKGWSMVLSYKDANGQISVKDGAHCDASSAVDGSYYVWLKGYDSHNGKVDYSSISGSGSMSIALGDEASKFSDYKTYKGTVTGMLASLKANGLRINGHDWTLIGIALYGPKTTAASNGLTGCIDFKRYLSASQWRAMSLPYNLDEEQTAKLFGNDAKITTLKSVVSDDQKKTLSISFGPVNSIEANKPYLVKVPADRQEFVLEGVSLDVDKFTSTSVNINGVSFVSTAPVEDGTDRTELPMNAYYLSNNVFYPHKNNKVTIKAGLCYMVLGAEAAAKGYSLNFQNEDGSVTGIQEIPAARENKAMEIYTLQGVRVLRPGKGIYIVNGKKMVF
uniref:cellulase family glycosylhydrolase n=1 Tax=Segatella hominis TaxID=2518605 RepID=UPI004025B75F